jgi:hypothetical protein
MRIHGTRFYFFPALFSPSLPLSLNFTSYKSKSPKTEHLQPFSQNEYTSTTQATTTQNPNMACSQLSTVRGLAPEKLIKLAFEFLSPSTLQAVFATLHPTKDHILEQHQRGRVSLHRLADTLYYHRGAMLSRLSRWNEMTIL